MSDQRDYRNLSIWELFGHEVEDKTASLTRGLLALERHAPSNQALEELMRAAHSLKGAASMVEAREAVQVAHAMEDWFEDLRKDRRPVSSARLDLLLDGVDLLRRIAAAPEHDKGTAQAGNVADFVARLAIADQLPEAEADEQPPHAAADTVDDQSVRVTAERLNRLLGLAGEALVNSRAWENFIRAATRNGGLPLDTRAALDELQQRGAAVAAKLYREVVDLRMRPFGESVDHMALLVRTLARELGKEARLQIEGAATPVDRDIMERLEAPIVNLIRNAIDHGLESPAERQQIGKPRGGTIRLSAAHRSGMLFVAVEDDGRGVNFEQLRAIIVERKLVTGEVADRLSEPELLDFLFLPGFSLRTDVTEFSGRGVGLDIVQTSARAVGGRVTVQSRPGRGLRFEFQLPLTLSVIRALLVDISGEPYAIPLARVGRVLRPARQELNPIEGRQHLSVDGETIGLVAAEQVLGIPPRPLTDDVLSVVVVGEGQDRYGLMVGRLLGESELVVRPLDPMLGKVKDVSSAALLPDNTTVLILDMDDLLHSIHHLVTGGRLTISTDAPEAAGTEQAKRILVVDDSFTVRELEKKLLTRQGYQVDVAIDGMDGWNAVRTGNYDLVLTDVDMPRMDGIELVTRIRQDVRLQTLPVMIVSYKEREEDRLRGMEAGADRYLTKGSYQDESMIDAVRELIGPGRNS